ncbi:MAG: endonuclease III [Bdellovibrionales bacterium]|nr:endonuclease III [Bdellovibrionales bacterium]
MAKPHQPTRKSVLRTYKALEKAYPDPRTELTYDSPFQLLIAVILSAQCTDERVNKTTPGLFAKYPTAQQLAKAGQADVEKLIHSCGFYRAKAKAIISTSKDLVEKFGGKIPGDLDKLTTLAGVGRKTASVILNQAFDVPAIAVDTHVKRVSQRLGWAHSNTPEKIEFELRALLPPKLWGSVNGMLILHGRRLCKARKPNCAECFLRDDCEFFQSGGEGSKSR